MKRLRRFVRGSSSQTSQPTQHENETQDDLVEDIPPHVPDDDNNVDASLPSSS